MSIAATVVVYKQRNCGKLWFIDRLTDDINVFSIRENFLAYYRITGDKISL